MEKWCCIAALFILSCHNPNNTSVDKKQGRETLPKAISKNKEAGITIGTIKIEETTIDGCSGLFSAVSKEVRSSYHFIINLQSKAFIHLDGKKVELVRVQSNNQDGVINEVYEGAGYTISIKLHETQELGDELSQYKGQLFIKRNSLQETLNIIGEVGC